MLHDTLSIPPELLVLFSKLLPMMRRLFTFSGPAGQATSGQNTLLGKGGGDLIRDKEVSNQSHVIVYRLKI